MMNNVENCKTDIGTEFRILVATRWTGAALFTRVLFVHTVLKLRLITRASKERLDIEMRVDHVIASDLRRLAGLTQ